MLSLIAAIAEDGAIGKQQALLCHLPNDLKRFKTITSGHTVIMGRRTFESLPNGALPNRNNIVVTHNKNAILKNARIATDIEEALLIEQPDKEQFVIGGATLYEQTITLADRLYITFIHHKFPEADTFFPTIDPAIWIEVEREEMPADERHPYPYAFVIYERRR